ncbi:LysR family transcriptional regulator [Luteibacter pinisoli]|nr:LysR family transcriptional regulator [Luteibacter pinisoli]
MQLFIRVADTGSFSRAASASAVAQSTVSKQIAALESRLGAQLFRRTTRRISLTEAGQDYYDSAMRVIENIDEAEARIGRGQVAPSGLLRVALSPAFGRFYVMPFLPEFLEQYPDVTVDFEISDRHADLVGDGIDLAIRIGPLMDSSLVARRIGGARYATVATPGYLERHGEPVHPKDVESMPCVVFMFHGAPRSWRFVDGSDAVTFEPRSVVRSNDADYLRSAVLNGIGMGHNPGWLYAADIRAGRLRQVLDEYSPPPFPISALTPMGRRQPRKAQVFTEFLHEKFRTIPELSHGR